MRLGIFGAGMIVHDFLSMVHQLKGIELAYICATPAESDLLKKLCKDYAIPRYYVDIDEAFCDDTADTCYIAVPNHLHYDFAKKALLAHRHVICEKPLTANAAQAKELAALAEAKGRMLVEAMSTYYLPNAKRIKELLPTLGEIKLAVFNFSSYSSRYDRFKAGEILPAFDCRKAGGALMDLNIYQISLAVYLFGRPQAIAYYANIQRGIDTSGVLILSYEGFQAVLIAAKDCKAPVSATIQGDQQCLLLKGPANMLEGYQVMDAHGRDWMKDDGCYKSENDSGKHRMYDEFTEFIRIVKEEDLQAARRMLAYSLMAMEIQNEARQKAGIVFPADAAYE